MGDKRIFYGLCTWWESIYETASTPEAIPCCPKCGRVGFEMKDIKTWYEGVDEHEKNHPGYRKFIDWLKGKCFLNYEVAKKTYEKEKTP